MRHNLAKVKHANTATQYDVKLELDVRSQKLIERTLRGVFPGIPVLGEEGNAGRVDAEYRWVVDPIDGTVNFSYGIPHACVSIALQRQAARPGPGTYEHGYETLLGVVYDPFCDEMWTAVQGGPARLNGRPIRVSKRKNLYEAILSMGFGKTARMLKLSLPCFNRLVRRTRRIRMMGSAALALAYVATGRFDAYIERGIRLWDIAAGGVIVECAGGEFWRKATGARYEYQMVASNGRLRKALQGMQI
jgi:myo-inositol-1(or 4)-monophosphatase